MLVFIKIAAAFLLSCILPACSGAIRLRTHNIISPEASVGTLSDASSYAQNLESGFKNKVFAIFKSPSLRERCLKRIGGHANLSLDQFSLDQREEFDNVHLVFIDLYRIFYSATEPVIRSWNSQKNPAEPFHSPREQSLEFMQFMLSLRINFSGNPNNPYLSATQDQNQILLTRLKLLSDTINQCYIMPFNSYIDGGDWNVFKGCVDIGRVKAYEAILPLCKEIEKIEPEQEENDEVDR